MRTSQTPRLVLSMLVALALCCLSACDDGGGGTGTDDTGTPSDTAGADADATSPDTACSAGEERCDGVCTPTASDPDNCGGCDVACGADEVCADGACQTECPASTTTCDRACVDTETDDRHCGACGDACAAGESCVAGTCEAPACEAGRVDCGGECVDTNTDELHCGACDNACNGAESCMEGTCVEPDPVGPDGPVDPVPGCDPPVSPVDTSDAANIDHVIGDGSAESCTHDALAAAVADGGVITFDCGADPVTIDVTSALQLRTDVDTVIDGGFLVTLDGGRLDGRTTRIFEYDSPNFRATDTLVVLQRLTVQNAEAPAEDFTPQDPDNEECAWGYKDGEGGALRMRDGRLHVIDSIFRNNMAASPGPDTGGGAIFAVGALEVVVVGSLFVGNEGSNGGAIGLLQSDGIFYNSVFEENRATGMGQNFGGATGCPEFNHAEQGGAGGNSGAIGVDGSSVEQLELCGVTFRNNSANELGTVTRTPNTQRGTSTFDKVLFDGNHAGDGGGAIWMQDMTFEMRDSAVVNNTSDGLGAGVRISQGPHGSTILIENTTFYRNVANNSLGGGLVFSGEGTVRNCTFAENEAAGGEGFFGAAIVAHGDESANLEVHNTIFWNNIDNHEWTPMTCSIGSAGDPSTLPGTGNVQWPELRNGPNDVPDNPCTPDILWADAMLQPLADNGGPTPTMMPASDSVAIGLGESCPATDQRGEPRPSSGCTAGAVER